MGTVHHHQSRSADFLRRARDATDAALAAGRASLPAHDRALAEAAECLSRAASHAVTALAVHGGFRHNTTRRLQIVLHESVYMERLRRGHLRTFRQTYTLPAVLDLPNIGRVSPKAAANADSFDHGDGDVNATNARNGDRAGAGSRSRSHNAANARNRNDVNTADANAAGNRPHNYRPHHRRRPETAGHRPMITPIQTIRKLGRRVNALRKAIAALIEGRARPIQRAQRSFRYDPDDLPKLTDKCAIIRYAGEIARLPNFKSFLWRFDLADTPMSTPFDGIIPPGAAARRRLCRCAPEPRHTLADHKDNIILAPQWRAALTQAYPSLKIPLLLPF